MTQEQRQPLEVPKNERSVYGVLVGVLLDIGVNLLMQEKVR